MLKQGMPKYFTERFQKLPANSQRASVGMIVGKLHSFRCGMCGTTPIPSPCYICQTCEGEDARLVICHGCLKYHAGSHELTCYRNQGPSAEIAGAVAPFCSVAIPAAVDIDDDNKAEEELDLSDQAEVWGLKIVPGARQVKGEMQYFCQWSHPVKTFPDCWCSRSQLLNLWHLAPPYDDHDSLVALLDAQFLEARFGERKPRNKSRKRKRKKKPEPEPAQEPELEEKAADAQ
jgi:hypothetical protein